MLQMFEVNEAYVRDHAVCAVPHIERYNTCESYGRAETASTADAVLRVSSDAARAARLAGDLQRTRLRYPCRQSPLSQGASSFRRSAADQAPMHAHRLVLDDVGVHEEVAARLARERGMNRPRERAIVPAGAHHVAKAERAT
ncbi:MAG: hypothetical protein H6723_09220 [Sandaracinus sp.]|nr:hypothetical protein [Sandaracinus sp.]